MKRIGGRLVFCLVVIGLEAVLTVGMVAAQQKEADIFDEHDTRVFKAAGCTKDNKPVEALYYIVASRSDLAAGRPSPSSQFIKEEVDKNWQRIVARLTMEQIMEEQFAKTYHDLLNETIPLLQRAVEEKSGLSIVISEVNSRPMDGAKDQDVPVCRQQ